RGVPAGRGSPPGDRGDGRLGRQVQPRDRRLPGPGSAADEVLPAGQPHRRSLRRPQPGVLVPAARGLRRVRGRGQVMTENTQTDTARPKETPLHAEHVELGASFTDFGGWDMPLKYGSELAEHRAVREAAGIFDLSHMGEVRITGADAAAFLDYAMVAKYSKMKVGKARYGVLVNEGGYIVDDLITYRIGDEEFLIVPNASNTDAVVAALKDRVETFVTDIAPGAAVRLFDESDDTVLIAVQGPNSEAIILRALDDSADGEFGPRTGTGDEANAEVTGAVNGGAASARQEKITIGEAVRELRYYACIPLTTAGIDLMLARTGYTGEDGFELYAPNIGATRLWETLVNSGADYGLVPCGLAARDSLRLEAGMPLYGNE